MHSKLEINYQTLTFDALSQEDQEGIRGAEAAMKGAHAPYSNFKVGSAVRLQNGQVITGSNQENAAYPSGLCAERVALFATRAQHKEPILAIYVVATNEKGKLANAYSCGGCRQVMMEYASLQQTPIRLLMQNHNSSYIVLDDVRLLMPFLFEANTMK